ncbi:MAG TPA: PQQ-binding-like beta-propeller repeat protein [Bryobacterales bacterium]|nr:PQQ-binding-like beta-propeller repeat protein [Bryobacterales bacterium]
MRARNLVVLLFSTLLLAQSRVATDWLTFGGNPQRTGWAAQEKHFSKDNVSKLQLLWKSQLDNAPLEMSSLSAPIVLENAITPHGFKDLVYIAGSSDNLYALDSETGKPLWQKHFENPDQPKRRHWLCPGDLNATPVVDKKSRTIFLITSDGKLHGLNIINGEDRFPPTQFVLPFSKNWSLNFVDGVVYTAISQGCGGARSGVYAMKVSDPARPVMQFYDSIGGGAGIWGRAGVVAGSNGLIYAQTGDGVWDPPNGRFADTVLALSAGDLKLVDYFTPANRAFITKKDLDMGSASPVAFHFKNWELIASAGKEGAIFLLDAASLGGADHRTPLFRQRYSNDDIDFAGRGVWGSLSTYEDDQGERWLLAPTWGPPSEEAPKFKYANGSAPNGSIMAFHLGVENNKPALEPVWISRDFNGPDPPVIAGNVVFALSTGEYARQVREDGALFTSPERVKNKTGNAVLYALDAATGKELYSSRDTIDSWTHFSGLAVSSGRVYVTTFDSRVYCFGFKEQQ